MKKSSINILQAFETATALRQAEHDANDAVKKGYYRAGMTGLSLDGTIYGKCARKLFLRAENIKAEEVPADRVNMFAGGLMNEEVVVEDLKLGLSHYSILREEEVPTRWETTTSSTPVTGRPDIVFQDPDTKELVLGLELKMMSSVWTARAVAMGKPKFYHMTQAAHYMWQHNIPFKLVYKSYVDFAVPNYGRYFPKPEDKGSEHIEYKPSKGYMNAHKILPFTKVFDLKFSNEGVLLFKEENDTVYDTTVITKEGIKEYFEQLDKSLEGEVLPPRPKNIDIFGKKEGWTDCSYCPLVSVCDTYEHDLQEWKAAIENQIPQTQEKDHGI